MCTIVNRGRYFGDNTKDIRNENANINNEISYETRPPSTSRLSALSQSMYSELVLNEPSKE